jgi:hypothetical protein
MCLQAAAKWQAAVLQEVMHKHNNRWGKRHYKLQLQLS